MHANRTDFCLLHGSPNLTIPFFQASFSLSHRIWPVDEGTNRYNLVPICAILQAVTASSYRCFDDYSTTWSLQKLFSWNTTIFDSISDTLHFDRWLPYQYGDSPSKAVSLLDGFLAIFRLQVPKNLSTGMWRPSFSLQLFILFPVTFLCFSPDLEVFIQAQLWLKDVFLRLHHRFAKKA